MMQAADAVTCDEINARSQPFPVTCTYHLKLPLDSIIFI